MRAVSTEPGGMVARPAIVKAPEYIAGCAVSGVGVIVGSTTTGGMVATTTGVGLATMGTAGVEVSSGSGVGDGVTRCGKVKSNVGNALEGGSGGPGK